MIFPLLAQIRTCVSRPQVVAGTRIIPGTSSHRHHYSLGWNLPGTNINWERLAAESAASNQSYELSLPLDEANAANYLIDLRTSTILARVQDLHYWETGQSDLNHAALYPIWFWDDSQVVFFYDGKWSFRAITAVQLRGGTPPLQAQIGPDLERYVRKHLDERHHRDYQREKTEIAIDLEDLHYTGRNRLVAFVVAGVPKWFRRFGYRGRLSIILHPSRKSLRFKFRPLHDTHFEANPNAASD